MENTKLKIIHEYLKYDLDPYVFVIHLISNMTSHFSVYLTMLGAVVLS